MPDPYNYNIQAANPLMSGLQGIQAAQQQQQNAMQMRMQQQAMADESIKRQRQHEYQQQIIGLTEKPYASAQDYIKLQAQYPESMEAIKQQQQSMSKAQLAADTAQVQKVNSALAAQKPKIAKQQLEQYQMALENSGRSDQAQAIGNIISMVDDNPGVVSVELNKYLLAQMGPEEFIKNFQQEQARKAGLQAKGKQKTGAWLVVDEKGNYSIVTGSYDPSTGGLTTSMGKLPEGMKLVSAVGQTPEEKAALDVLTTGQKKQAEISAKSEEERTQDFIGQGLAAAESLPTLKRSMELLNTVKTGGFNKALIGAKQFFGIEAADEGELSYNLSKNVLGQLRSTFGAAFTEREGARLDSIEAGLGRNPATNRSILNNAMRMAQRKVDKAIILAKKKGDIDTVQELKDLMNFSLNPNAPAQTPPPAAGQPAPQPAQPITVQAGEQTATNPNTGEKIVYRNGQWLNINTGAPIQ